MLRKEKAAKMPSRGIFSFGTVSLTFLTDLYQTGTMAAAMTAQVSGLR